MWYIWTLVKVMWTYNSNYAAWLHGSQFARTPSCPVKLWKHSCMSWARGIGSFNLSTYVFLVNILKVSSYALRCGNTKTCVDLTRLASAKVHVRPNLVTSLALGDICGVPWVKHRFIPILFLFTSALLWKNATRFAWGGISDIQAIITAGKSVFLQRRGEKLSRFL